MEDPSTLMQYFELNDGEIFVIQQIDVMDGEILDQIVIERQTAINMATDILKMMGSNYTTLPATR